MLAFYVFSGEEVHKGSKMSYQPHYRELRNYTLATSDTDNHEDGTIACNL